MAEELRLQQVLGDGRSVDGHERTTRAGTVLVQCARHQLLARAALAGDHHGDMALAEAANPAEDVLHGRGLAEHLWHGAGAGLHHVLAQALVHRTADQLHGLGHVKGLGQVLEGAALEGRDRAVDVGVRRHDDDGQPRHAGLHLGQQIDARATGHADVADQHLRLVVIVQRRHHVAA